MSIWPLQSECDAFYGNPRGRDGKANAKWEHDNIVRIQPPFAMTYAGMPVKTIRIHRRCAESLTDILREIAALSNGSALRQHEWGVSIYGGAYNYRLMRGSSKLSMHSWGCAIDLDPERNAFHDTTPHFADIPLVVKAFESRGWIWGGRWKGRSCDGMHFQAARVS